MIFSIVLSFFQSLHWLKISERNPIHSLYEWWRKSVEKSEIWGGGAENAEWKMCMAPDSRNGERVIFLPNVIKIDPYMSYTVSISKLVHFWETVQYQFIWWMKIFMVVNDYS